MLFILTNHELIIVIINELIFFKCQFKFLIRYLFICGYNLYKQKLFGVPKNFKSVNGSGDQKV